jgi:protein YIPF5/7
MVNKEQSLELYTIMSVLGYCLLPFTILASVTVFLPVFNVFGGALSLLIIAWSTYMATQFIDVMLNAENKRMIIAYPIFLFYMCFLLLAIF